MAYAAWHIFSSGAGPPTGACGTRLRSVSQTPRPSSLRSYECRGRCLAGVLPEHNPAAATRGGEGSECGLGPDFDLPRTSGASELFDAIGVHSGAGAPIPQIATAGAEGMRTLDADITRVKRESISTLHAMPLERFQEKLGHGGVPIVGVEDVDVLWAKPGPLIHPPGRAAGPLFDFVQVWLGRALS